MVKLIEIDGGETTSLKRRREEEEKSSPDTIKKKSFHWNWNDECIILKNFYEFAGKNGSYTKDFYHFVKEKLSVKVSNSQLSDKVYRLRKKFMKNKSMMEEGENIGTSTKYFTSVEHQKLFEMSNNIWGSDHNQSEAVDRWNAKLFGDVFERLKLDISRISPDVLEDIRKDWDDMRTSENEYNLLNADLLLQISDIRCTQNI